MRKTLAALVLAAGMAVPSNLSAIAISPDLRPWGEEPSNGTTERKGREMITRGEDYSPRFDCLMEVAPFTSYALEISPTDTYNDILHFFQERGVPYDRLNELRDYLRMKTNFSNPNLIVEPFLWGTNIVATNYECPVRVPWIPQEITGKVTSASLIKDKLELTLDTHSGVVVLPGVLRIDAGEFVRLYREEGLSGETLTDFDMIEVKDDKGKLKISYSP